jgi:hypothetical protein
MKQFSWQKLLIGLALAAGCMLVGATIPITNQAHGEVRAGAPEPPAFQQGTVPVLRDISATLRQIDGRLGRLEMLAQKMSSRAAASAQGATTAERAEESSN